jgi:hypothetical protein
MPPPLYDIFKYPFKPSINPLSTASLPYSLQDPFHPLQASFDPLHPLTDHYIPPYLLQTSFLSITRPSHLLQTLFNPLYPLQTCYTIQYSEYKQANQQWLEEVASRSQPYINRER